MSTTRPISPGLQALSLSIVALAVELVLPPLAILVGLCSGWMAYRSGRRQCWSCTASIVALGIAAVVVCVGALATIVGKGALRH
ncbi:hypothetical protein KEM60_00493 [Austwickia sp. TVS 96-490-7B]|uniref:hypothetical protein n=1 Tax=Austwickia sp. TVS 96-490-7B TaxID=2830843 RepID=UPI001C56BA11|nr:hypothetical protein [Austwickia sp. TVS 96-490-7B]MBW3084306.1 hypothetical protein [Austwickia sp. TVS 96-490-7B]